MPYSKTKPKDKTLARRSILFLTYNDTLHFQHPHLKWGQTFDQLCFKAQYYLETQRVLRSSRTSKKRLLLLYRAHLRLLAFENAITYEQYDALYEIAKKQQKPIIAALIYRVNCKQLQHAAALPPCLAACCCNCLSGYPSMPCTKRLAF